VSTTIANLTARGIPLGLDFLSRSSGMPIAETFLSFSPDESYGRAILVGVVNTLVVAAIAIVLASIAGLLVGIGRLSSNPLVAGLCRIWVETARNTPALVLLLFLYALWWQVLPPVREAINIAPGTYLSQRGLVMPRLSSNVSSTAVWAFLLITIALVLGARHGAAVIQARTGRRPRYVPVAIALSVATPVLAVMTGLATLSVEWPQWRRLNYIGGVELTPELTTIIVGLTLYTAGFIAEIVRAGILAIERGQWEAGRAVGLSEGQIMRLVIIPQALRVVVPPLTSQYINVIKNSTLAIAVGFQDFMTIMQTIINQTSHALEGVAIILGVYLLLNLALSVCLNIFNARMAIVER
jgi:general L-amino acid transport system permease protein